MSKKRLREFNKKGQLVRIECRGPFCKGEMIPVYEFSNPYRSYCRKCDSFKSDEYRSRAITDLRFLKEKARQARNHAKTKKFDCPVAPNLEKIILDRYFEQVGLCAITEIQLELKPCSPFSLSVDRKNPTLGYTEGNIQLVISSINLVKGKLEYAFKELMEKYGVEVYCKVLKQIWNELEPQTS
ncbi:hypothetical protein NDK43_25890 [Neobacillus pocheonensis]|uniref:Uncharacterized protein n=1 Tax=Neobacillus pocheonensis TaxID=363869 RepID=A0ABT0WFS3_9BACI|nr:hypothetical protein [Neobacillus pocheonensis]